MSTKQRTLIEVPSRYATVPIAGARARLELDDWQIDERMDNGTLWWVWDIATPGAAKRELRFLTAELGGEILPGEDEHVVAGYLFGEPKPFVDGTHFRRAFNCDGDHVLNLIRAGALVVLPGTGWHKGPNGTPAIAWDSAVQFMKERRIG